MRRRYYNRFYALTVNAPVSSVFRINNKSYSLGDNTSIVITLPMKSYNWTLNKSGYVTESGEVVLSKNTILDIVMYQRVSPSTESFTSYKGNYDLPVKSKYISILMYGGGGGAASTQKGTNGPGGGSGGSVNYMPNILSGGRRVVVSFSCGDGGAGGDEQSYDMQGFDGEDGSSSHLSMWIYNDDGTRKYLTPTAAGGQKGIRNASNGLGGNGYGAGGGGGNRNVHGGGGSGISGPGGDGIYASDGEGGPGGDGTYGYNGGNGFISNGGSSIKWPISIPVSSIFGGNPVGGSSYGQCGGGGAGYGRGGTGGKRASGGGIIPVPGGILPGPGGGGGAGEYPQRGGDGILVIYYHNDPI